MENNINCTFAIIKPDAVEQKNSGKIIDIIEQNNFEIVRLHKTIIDYDLAEDFYVEHKERPFYRELVDFITSGPVLIVVLFKENAVEEWRKLIGATNPAEALPGTIRHEFGTDIGKNAVHGSDSDISAVKELILFFPEIFEDFANEEKEENDDMSCDNQDECCEEEVCNG